MVKVQTKWSNWRVAAIIVLHEKVVNGIESATQSPKITYVGIGYGLDSV